ncbi:MAG: Holliday junction branch migration protein RuvA [Christensenellaceae bacterium]|jgi:Holliday junction DNA helicase RuvA|nr:Holliday junction branch migration protein RuvA [Christensenellaceae bacterium]
MYEYIRGIVDEIGPDRAVAEAAGVGYLLLCPATTLKTLQAGKEAKLYTHFHIAQDAIALYGFCSNEERAMFRRLIGVTRVGPKLALAVLSHLSVSDIAGAILTENADALSSVPGMGKKTAARLLLELKEKVSEDMRRAGLEQSYGGALDMRTEATAALVALGYDGVVAGRAVASADDCDRVEDLITQALKGLARQ